MTLGGRPVGCPPRVIVAGSGLKASSRRRSSAASPAALPACRHPRALHGRQRSPGAVLLASSLQPEITATDSSMADRVAKAFNPSLNLTDVLLVTSFQSDPGLQAGEKEVQQRRRIIVDAPRLRNGLLRISPLHPYALIGPTSCARVQRARRADAAARPNAYPPQSARLIHRSGISQRNPRSRSSASPGGFDLHAGRSRRRCRASGFPPSPVDSRRAMNP